MRISQENMAGIKDGSGIAKPKRRAWGKQRCKRDLVSIDHMDIAALTKVVEHNNKQCYAVDDLRNPESMATETLVNHLSRMKIPYASSRRGREGLLCLFRVHIQPKTQRVRFWRNKRRHEEDMEVGDTWTDCDITRKREHTGAYTDAPATKTKRVEVERTSVSPMALLSETLQTTSENTSNRRIIKIKRKSSLSISKERVSKVMPSEKDHTGTNTL